MSGRFRWGIEDVTDDRVPDAEKMHAQLMRPPCQWIEIEAGGIVGTCYDGPFGLRGLAGFADLLHRSIGPIRAHGRVD